MLAFGTWRLILSLDSKNVYYTSSLFSWVSRATARDSIPNCMGCVVDFVKTSPQADEAMSIGNTSPVSTRLSALAEILIVYGKGG